MLSLLITPVCSIVCQVYPALVSLLGFHGTFWVYSGVGAAMALYGWLVIPDNRGLSLVKIGRVNKYPNQAAHFFLPSFHIFGSWRSGPTNKFRTNN